MAPETNAEERIQRSCDVVRDCIRRRAAGQTVSDQSLIDSNPDLMPELGDHLAGLRVIENAQRQLDSHERNTPWRLWVRCPHCHDPCSLADDQQLSHAVCSGCGTSFGLVDDVITAEESQNESIGHFQLLECLGAGAFGTVFRALDTELHREVAVKIPRKGRFNEEDAERFIREARTAARLNHPSIVQVYEVGCDEDLYIATDLVQGTDLTHWMADQRATYREAARLCVKLADALEHAHRQGVIHRDLKPSNILIDDAGQPHLTDFGLAKRSEAGEVTMTVEGKLLGTPAYMSPEQARGKAHEADERSDVYSLGVILYELLTGERPFRGNTRMLLHQILVEDAPAPRKLNSNIPKDLETICLKCLEKSAVRRYQSAKELAEELRRFLQGEPIRARPISAAARTWRWATRNPWFAASAATAAGLLLAVSIGGPLIAFRVGSQAEISRWRSYVSDMHVAYQHWESARMPQVDALLKRHEPRDGQKDLRGFEWFVMKELSTPSVPIRRISYDAPGHIAFSPDGKTLAITGHTLTLWDLEKNKPIRKRDAHDSLVKPVAFSPGGDLLATGGWRDGELWLWRTTYERDTPILDAPIVLDAQENMQYDSLAFSLDGEYLATHGKNNTVAIWDVARQSVRELEGHTARVTCVASSPHGILASGSNDLSIRLWDFNKGEQIIELGEKTGQHTGGVLTVAFSPDGELLASGSHDDTVKLWQVSTGSLLATLERHSDYVVSVVFSPDGKTLASASADGVVNLWNVKRTLAQGDDEPIAFKGHAGNVLYVAFSPSGKVLASVGGGTGKEIILWDLSTLPQPIHFEGCDVRSSRGKALRAWTPDGLPQLCADSNVPHDPPEQREGAACISRSQDGKLVATGYQDGTVELQMLDTGETRQLRDRHNGPVANVLFSHNAKSMVSVAWINPLKSVLKLWNVATGDVVIKDMNVSPTVSPVFSDELGILATLNEDPVTHLFSIRLWRADTGMELDPIIEGQADPYFSLEFSLHGDMLAAGNHLGEITVWEVESRRQRLTLKAHTSNVVGLAFSPDGTRLASGSHDRTVKLWDLSTGDEMLTLNGHRRGILSVGFSPGGSTLASASTDGVVKLWRTSKE